LRLASKAPTNVQYVVPPTRQLLTQGGDARIQLDPANGTNKYGCRPLPDDALIQLGSSTASVISSRGFTAAEALRQQLESDAETESLIASYSRELDRIRRELQQLCRIKNIPGVEIVFAASGTDLHLIAGQLGASNQTATTRVIMVGAEETGSGVPSALAGCHFSNQTALGESAVDGQPIPNSRTTNISNIAIRHDDGSPRSIREIDTEVENLVKWSVAAGQRVLLIMVDVSKTGIIAPSPACVAALHRMFAHTVEVLVDACQFRIAPPTLQAYLQHGFMVAITGSKFLTGPSFSGALLLPAQITQRIRRLPSPMVLRDYCSRAEWPNDWPVADGLRNVANIGLLLRWEAALAELKAFHQIPESDVSDFLYAFADAVYTRLENDAAFEPLPINKLDRSPLVDTSSWDAITTIFPFIPYRTTGLGGRAPLHRKQTERLYQMLYSEPDAQHRLGQPVACGEHDSIPISALRICASTRLVVEAFSENGVGAEGIINRTQAALDRISLLTQLQFD